MSNIHELGKKAKGRGAGNSGSADAYCIKSAIHWALAQEYTDVQRGFALRKIATKAVQDALAGDAKAREWIGDRTEGKAPQRNIIEGDEDKPLITKIVREIVRPEHKDR